MLAAAGFAVIGVPTPAQAADCRLNNEYTSVSAAFSDTFRASDNCGGLFGRYGNSFADYVRGEYNRDGWQPSSLGAQYVPKRSDGSANQIIGNTVPDRQLRGIGSQYSQFVNYRF